MAHLNIDQLLLDCVLDGTIKGMEMTGVAPQPVGASCYINAQGTYSVIVSLYGERNGSMTLNMSELAVRHLVAGMFGEEDVPMDEDAFDAICEIGNIVAGRYKEALLGTPYEFNYISLPAMVVGVNYNLYYTRGITTAAVEFEIKELPALHMKDKFFTAAVSLMRK
jgi:CheY-specific phosphatase CheX